MNWLTILVLVILIGFAFKGRRDGFIKTVFSIVSVILALILTCVLTPYIGNMLQENKPLFESIYKMVSETIDLENNSNLKSVIDEKEAIDKLPLPRSLKNALIENNNTEIYEGMLVNNFEGYVYHYLTALILNAISFVIVFLIVIIILFILERTLDLFSKLPVINGLNKAAGFLVGILQGFLLIWFLCIVLTIFSGTSFAKEIYQCIDKSILLNHIYNNNLLLKVITNMAKVLF